MRLGFPQGGFSCISPARVWGASARRVFLTPSGPSARWAQRESSLPRLCAAHNVCCGNEWEPPPWLFAVSLSLSGVNYVTHWKCDAAADTTHTHTQSWSLPCCIVRFNGLGRNYLLYRSNMSLWLGKRGCEMPSSLRSLVLRWWENLGCTSVGTFDPFRSLSVYELWTFGLTHIAYMSFETAEIHMQLL